MKLISKPAGLITVAILTMLLVSQCKKINIVTTTTDDANLVTYMSRYPDKYSEFLKVLDKSGTASYLDAYGTYTLFAPTNTAVADYLKTIGKTSVEALSADELKNMVRYHLLGDTISTVAFTDGKLPVPTMYGEYLVTGINNTDGVSKYIVNRSAIVVTPNTYVGNGILHTIDHVLVPSKATLAVKIEQDGSYKIFTQALKETGFYDSLNTLKYISDTIPYWLTVLAQSDAVFKANGINSYTDLKAKYCNTGNPKNPVDSLHTFMGYHILTDLKFLADLVMTPAHASVIPQEIITITLKGQTVLANDETFAGVYEPGVEFNRSTSDIAATNGVLHDLKGNLYIKVRRPAPVYWDVAEQPEIMKLTAIFRKGGKSQDFAVGSMKDITWNAGTVNYTCNNPGAKDLFYWNDRLAFTYLRAASGSMNWVEFKTPLIVKGKYKVWICWRANNLKSARGVQTYIDGVLMPRLMNFGDYNYGKTLTEPEVQAQGWKRYYVGASTADHMASKLIGTIELTTTGRHTLKLVCTDDGGGNNATWLDMIHFIPEDMDQFLPKFNTDGSWVY
ncbi:MAG: fasciclin domain-containing protein [Chitinophagaceae bacterium]